MRKLLTWITAFAVIGATVGCTADKSANKADAPTSAITTTTAAAAAVTPSVTTDITETEAVTAETEKPMDEILKDLKSEVKTIIKIVNEPVSEKDTEDFSYTGFGRFLDERAREGSGLSVETFANLITSYGGTIKKYVTEEEAMESNDSYVIFDGTVFETFHRTYGVYVINFSLNLTNALTEDEQQELLDAIKKAIG